MVVECWVLLSCIRHRISTLYTYVTAYITIEYYEMLGLIKLVSANDYDILIRGIDQNY